MVRSSICLAFTIVLFSCNVQKTSIITIEFDYNFNRFKQTSVDQMTIDSLFEHYPKNIALDSIDFHLFFYPDTLITNDLTKQGSSFLVVKTENPGIDSSNLSSYTSFNLGFKDDDYCKTIDTNALKTDKRPIPDLMFVYEQDIKFSYILYNKAQSGDFWRQKNESFRPSCVGRWKNGYSKGVGIYKDSIGWKKMYWLMYW